jgi:hypothetical protein
VHPESASALSIAIFPTHRDLIEAAAEHRFAEIEDFARTECLLHTKPGQALARYLHHVGEVLAADRGLSASIEAARQATGSEPRGRDSYTNRNCHRRAHRTGSSRGHTPRRLLRLRRLRGRRCDIGDCPQRQ